MGQRDDAATWCILWCRMGDALSSDEVAVLGWLVTVDGAGRLSELAGFLSADRARLAVASLVQQALIEIDRVELLPKGQTTGRPVSPLTPDVPSTSRHSVTTLSREEAAAVVADPASWLSSSVGRTWFEATVGVEGEEAYFRSVRGRPA